MKFLIVIFLIESLIGTFALVMMAATMFCHVFEKNRLAALKVNLQREMRAEWELIQRSQPLPLSETLPPPKAKGNHCEPPRPWPEPPRRN